MTSTLDALIAPLTEAAMGELPPVAEATDIRERVAEALCAALRAQPHPNVGEDRLTPAKLREDATRLVKGTSSPDALVDLVADMLRQVREASQREEWIRQGYTASCLLMERQMVTAQREVGELRHAVRLVKRATRDVKVGRE